MCAIIAVLSLDYFCQCTIHSGQQAGDRNWFLQEVISLGSKMNPPLMLILIAAVQQYRQAGLFLPEQVCQFDAVLPGHDNIAEEQVEVALLLFEQFKGLFCVRGDGGFIACGFQNLNNHIAHSLIIFNQQNPHDESLFSINNTRIQTGKQEIYGASACSPFSLNFRPGGRGFFGGATSRAAVPDPAAGRLGSEAAGPLLVAHGAVEPGEIGGLRIVHGRGLGRKLLFEPGGVDQAGAGHREGARIVLSPRADLAISMSSSMRAAVSREPPPALAAARKATRAVMAGLRRSRDA